MSESRGIHAVSIVSDDNTNVSRVANFFQRDRNLGGFCLESFIH
jgi:hypothetical protein